MAARALTELTTDGRLAALEEAVAMLLVSQREAEDHKSERARRELAFVASCKSELKITPGY